MSRRSPRVRARFAATVQIGGVEHTLICHTRDISTEGCFLETSELMAPGVGVALSVMDNDRGEVVTVEGHITRVIDDDERGVGVRLIDPPDEWFLLVQRFQDSNESDRERPNIRLNILVVSSAANRRGALALYVTSGWDIRFAVDAATATEALEGFELDAVICEYEAHDSTWRSILDIAVSKQPQARRLVRCRTDVLLPKHGAEELVHRFVDIDNGMDALLDALTAEIGVLRQALSDPMTGALALSAQASKRLLQDVIDRMSVDERAIAVFDLDSTLLDNAPRQSAILREYGRELAVPELQNSEPEHWVSWDVAEAMANSGLGAEGVEEHRDAFKQYWRERFFTSDYCRMDEMVAGASDYVQAIRSAGGKVYYVTGRHEEMRAGTVECLERLGFPIPDESEVRLLMKPTLDEDDDTYKHETYALLAREGTIVAAFDNEPTHINGYHVAFPEAYSVHLATDHSGREVKVLEGVLSILDFEL